MPKNRRNDSKTHSIALSGLLFALAMALSFIEGTLVIPGLLPGMKLGLANIVVMYALFFMGPKQALVLDILKALFVFFGVRLDGGVPLAVRRSALAFGDVAAVLSFPGAADMVYPVGLRCTGPQHRSASGSQRDPFHRRLPLLRAGHAGAGACDGRTDVRYPPRHPARTGSSRLQHPRTSWRIRGFAYV